MIAPSIAADRLQRAAVLAVIAIPAIFLAFYGVHGGMPWDYSLTYVSELTPGLEGFLYGDPLRIYTNVFYNVGYLLPGLVHAQGSWVGYHVVYALLWAAKGLLVLWLSSLFDLPMVIGAPAAVIAVAHGSDISIGHVGQINQFGIIFWTLLSMCCFLYFLRHKGFSRYVLLLVAIGSSYFGLWSYEGTLFGLLVYPALFNWVAGRWKDWSCWLGAAMVTAPAIIYSGLIVERLIVERTGESYQESVLRKDIHNIGALAHDYFHLLRGLFDVPGWLTAKLEIFNVPMASLVSQLFLASATLALMVTLYFCVRLTITQYRVEKARANIRPLRAEALGPKTFQLIAMLFILASAFLAPFLALDEAAAGYWRTQILAGPFASILIVVLLYFLFIYLPQPVMHSKIATAAMYSGALLLVTMAGFTANAVSYQAYNDEWEQTRGPIERLLKTVPGVKPGTIIMLQGVPVGAAPWGSNFWFDILIRLAYPKIEVAGAYSFDLASASAEEVKNIVGSGGQVLQLQNGRQVLVPHGHAFVIEDDQVHLAEAYLPTLITSATIENAIVLKWSANGPLKIIHNVDEIELAENPTRGRYNPDARIDLTGLSAVARRRFFE